MPDIIEVAAFHLDVRRLWTHFILFLFTACVCLYFLSIRLEGGFIHLLTIVLGYLSLLYIVVTLAIGPLNLLVRRRNPVSIALRRDTGIWAAITGCLHVYFGLQTRFGGLLWPFFFTRTSSGFYLPQLSLFGLSNYAGLLATLLLIALLVLSNDITLRRMRGPLWKVLQRSNYVLFAFAVLHMLGYQAVLSREPVIRDFSYAVVLVALIAQALGITLYRLHRSRARSRARSAFPDQTPNY